MTKTEMVIARKAEVAKSIDAAVKEVLALKAQYDEMEKQLKELKVETEAKFFQLPASVKERLEGEEYFLEKVPVLTKKEYDTKQLKVLLEAAGVDIKSVLTRKMVTTVDEKALKNLVKEEKITQEMVNKTISGNQSYRAYYGKIDK
jgi:hypothetical protein